MNELVMTVEDVFQIYGKGIVLLGTVSVDKIKTASIVQLEDEEGTVIQSEHSKYGKTYPLRIMAIESFSKIHDEACKGDKVGFLFRGLDQPPEKGMRIVRKIDEKA